MRLTLELDAGGTEKVPAILQLPEGTGPVPGALLLHGFTARKEEMADWIGRALLERGVASLAVDLPVHGERNGSLEGLSLQNPIAIVHAWRLALTEARVGVGYLTKHAAIDRRRIGIVGYSLGA